MTYQQAIQARLGQTGRQLRSLQLGLIVSYIEHSDWANYFLQPATFATLHQSLQVKFWFSHGLI